jgi:hypothetical protein
MMGRRGCRSFSLRTSMSDHRYSPPGRESHTPNSIFERTLRSTGIQECTSSVSMPMGSRELLVLASFITSRTTTPPSISPRRTNGFHSRVVAVTPERGRSRSKQRTDRAVVEPTRSQAHSLTSSRSATATIPKPQMGPSATLISSTSRGHCTTPTSKSGKTRSSRKTGSRPRIPIQFISTVLA